MQKYMPKLNTNTIRTALFALALIVATVQPVLGVMLPLVFAVFVLGRSRAIMGEQRVRLVYLACGGLSGLLLNFGLTVHATQPELLNLLM